MRVYCIYNYLCRVNRVVNRKCIFMHYCSNAQCSLLSCNSISFCWVWNWILLPYNCSVVACMNGNVEWWLGCSYSSVCVCVCVCQFSLDFIYLTVSLAVMFEWCQFVVLHFLAVCKCIHICIKCLLNVRLSSHVCSDVNIRIMACDAISWFKTVLVL
jgi:hypothetical protein